jgi:outer membrane protein W
MNKRFAIAALVWVLPGFILVSPTFLSAQYERQINLFGGIGFAVSDYEGLVLDIGTEFQITHAFFAQFSIDYYTNPLGADVDTSLGAVDFSVVGFNLYGVYKVSPSERLNLFAKAGIHYTTLKASATVDGFLDVSETDSDFGAAGGIGIQYFFNYRLGIVFGGTGKLLFAGDTLNWFKIYSGVIYRIR